MQRKKGIVKISYLRNSAKPCKHWKKEELGRDIDVRAFIKSPIIKKK